VDYKGFQDLLTASRREGKAVVTTNFDSSYVPKKLLQRQLTTSTTLSLAGFMLGATSRVMNSSLDRGGTNTRDDVDLLPFLITQMSSADRQTALAVLHLAPAIDGEPYSAIN
jgi:hypothetical protein